MCVIYFLFLVHVQHACVHVLYVWYASVRVCIRYVWYIWDVCLTCELCVAFICVGCVFGMCLMYVNYVWCWGGVCVFLYGICMWCVCVWYIWNIFGVCSVHIDLWWVCCEVYVLCACNLCVLCVWYK